MVVNEADDFWNATRFASYKPVGTEMRHGPWTSYYQNGKTQVEGFYQYDKEMGNFTWWHSNGQKAVEGAYRDGVEDGVWTRWHENGQKASIGNFVDGAQEGLWRQWDASGRLQQKLVHDGSKPATTPTARDLDEPAALEANKEAPPLPWTVR